MIKSEDGIKRRVDFFWSVGDFSFGKDTIGHIFTGQYYGLHKNVLLFINSSDNLAICNRDISVYALKLLLFIVKHFK